MLAFSWDGMILQSSWDQNRFVMLSTRGSLIKFLLDSDGEDSDGKCISNVCMTGIVCKVVLTIGSQGLVHGSKCFIHRPTEPTSTEQRTFFIGALSGYLLSES